MPSLKVRIDRHAPAVKRLALVTVVDGAREDRLGVVVIVQGQTYVFQVIIAFDARCGIGDLRYGDQQESQTGQDSQASRQDSTDGVSLSNQGTVAAPNLPETVKTQKDGWYPGQDGAAEGLAPQHQARMGPATGLRPGLVADDRS